MCVPPQPTYCFDATTQVPEEIYEVLRWFYAGHGAKHWPSADDIRNEEDENSGPLREWLSYADIKGVRCATFMGTDS